MQHWMGLGSQSQACITVPETCGSQGGSMSVWFKVIDYQPHSAIIGNIFDVPKTSVSITCWNSKLR